MDLFYLIILIVLIIIIGITIYIAVYNINRVKKSKAPTLAKYGELIIPNCAMTSNDSTCTDILNIQDKNNSNNSNNSSIIRWSNWPLYIDYDEKTKKYTTLENFQSKNNIQVNYLEDYNDNDEFFEKVQAQLKLGKDIGYDVITPTGRMLDIYIRLGYLKKLDSTKLNKSKLLFKNESSKRLDYARPWQGIISGFGWNVKTNPKGIKTLNDLFSPQNKGKIVLLSEMRDTMGIIMLAQGVDVTKFTDAQFMRAIDFLKKKIKEGWIRGVKGNDYAEDLTSGDATAVIGWSGDMFILATEQEGKFNFAIPNSGGILSYDYMAIPSTSTIPIDNIYKLFNHYSEPKVAAEVAAYVNYICPYVGAQIEMEKIDPELAKSKYIFPTPNDIKKLNIFRELTPSEEKKYTEAFQKAIGN